MRLTKTVGVLAVHHGHLLWHFISIILLNLYKNLSITSLLICKKGSVNKLFNVTSKMARWTFEQKSVQPQMLVHICYVTLLLQIAI